MLVSAAIGGGPPRRVLQLARTDRIELVLPDLVIEELIRVLAVKFGWTRDRLRQHVAMLERLATEHPAAPTAADPHTDDPADDRILACAIAHGVDVIASGNKRHLLSLGAKGRVRILTPQALLAELRTAG